jgi:hypothetical protein
MAVKKAISFGKRKKLAKLQDENFKRRKKASAFDDTEHKTKTGDFDMPVYWQMLFRHTKSLRVPNCYFVSNKVVELLGVKVRFENETTMKNIINVKNYEFVPFDSKTANDSGMDTDAFVLNFDSESDAEQAAEMFLANRFSLNASFVTAQGAVLTTIDDAA